MNHDGQMQFPLVQAHVTQVDAEDLRFFVERIERLEAQARAKQSVILQNLAQLGWAMWPDGVRGKDGRRLPAPMPRFLSKVRFNPDGCLIWRGPLSNTGYGIFRVYGRPVLAHRWICEVIRGPIEGGLVVDHLCSVRSCVHPMHLEPVTQSVNVRRGRSPETTRRMQMAKTHCPRGHPYSGDNLYVSPNGGRACRICGNKRKLDFQRKKRAKI